jgi:DNA-binding MarR family transcriptional regulator
LRYGRRQSIDETQGGFLISQIKQIQGRIFERLLNEDDIQEFNGAQGRILYVLWQEDQLPIVELSKRTGLAKTTLTGMLDRMEIQGYVVRLHDLSDRRQLLIALTDKARSLKDGYRQVSDRMSELFYQGFSQEEIRVFENALRRILNNLTKREERV